MRCHARHYYFSGARWRDASRRDAVFVFLFPSRQRVLSFPQTNAMPRARARVHYYARLIFFRRRRARERRRHAFFIIRDIIFLPFCFSPFARLLRFSAAVIFDMLFITRKRLVFRLRSFLFLLI